MHNQLLRGLIFIILVFLVTSDLKEIISSLATSTTFGAFLQHRQSPSRSSSHQRSRRQVSPGSSQSRVNEGSNFYNDETPSTAGSKMSNIKSSHPANAINSDEGSPTSSDFNDPDSLDSVRRLNNRGQSSYAKRKVMKLNADEKKELLAMKTQLTAVMQEWCLPKLVCELHASVSDRGSLTEAEKGLLSLIRETSLGTMGEVVSRYHFAAHMGQLLSGVEGNGCHNFYPNCPLSGSKVLQMMKKVRIR